MLQFAARRRIGRGKAPERFGNLGGCPLGQFAMRGPAVGAEARLVLAELEQGSVRSGLDVGIPDDPDDLAETIARAGAWEPLNADLDADDLAGAVRGRGDDLAADDFDLDLDGASR